MDIELKVWAIRDWIAFIFLELCFSLLLSLGLRWVTLMVVYYRFQSGGARKGVQQVARKGG